MLAAIRIYGPQYIAPILEIIFLRLWVKHSLHHTNIISQHNDFLLMHGCTARKGAHIFPHPPTYYSDLLGHNNLVWGVRLNLGIHASLCMHV